jgi:putative transposase
MRRTHHTLSAAEVQQHFVHLMAPLLGPWPAVRTCTLQAVLSVLAYAAARITSVTDACLRLADAPDSDTILGHLARQLPTGDLLDRRIRRTLVGHLPRAIRRSRWTIALDTTLIPYHGQPFAQPAEIYRGQPKSGTTHFHAYATAYLVRAGCRFTLALIGVRHGDTPDQIVRQLCRRVVAAGVKPKLFLLDRGFQTAGVVRYLQAARYAFIMPQAVHGKAPAHARLTGLRALRAHHPTGWTTYTWKPRGQRRVCVELCVLRRRRRDRRGHRAFLYACGRVRMTPSTVYATYRRRFGVETSYRQMNQTRIRTTTRRPTLRLLFVALALLLRNLWVWLHWSLLAARRRGHRQVQLRCLRLRTLTLWLAHLAESVFRYSDQTPAERLPDEGVGPIQHGGR